jgi:hypothetical protein
VRFFFLHLSRVTARVSLTRNYESVSGEEKSLV